MIDLNGTGLALAQLTLIVLAGPAFAQTTTTIAHAAQSTEYGSGVNQNHVPTATLVPEDFDVPTLVETSDFKIVPLSPAITKIDFAAYMSSIKHLQETFTRSTDWPHEGISDADALRDMEAEQARFRSRTSFAYAVLTPDGSRERGRSLEDVLYDAADPTSFYPADDRVEFHYEVIIESDHNSDIDP